LSAALGPSVNRLPQEAKIRGAQTRAEIVAEADRLFYQGGFEHTSFAEIAGAVQIARGNFYYHFKSKDEILAAVIARRVETTNALLARWTADNPTPRARLLAFVHILEANGDEIMRYGCPVGSLAVELSKLMHEAHGGAVSLFDLFRDWLSGQFRALGSADPNALALHLLMRSQGVAVLYAAYRDARFVAREMAAMEDWIDSVAGLHAAASA
jgi:TetR/AcrR family transcriptional repressor of nem operon